MLTEGAALANKLTTKLFADYRQDYQGPNTAAAVTSYVREQFQRRYYEWDRTQQRPSRATAAATAEVPPLLFHQVDDAEEAAMDADGSDVGAGTGDATDPSMYPFIGYAPQLVLHVHPPTYLTLQRRTLGVLGRESVCVMSVLCHTML